MNPKHLLRIRNSTAEFLIFTRQAGEDGIEVQEPPSIGTIKPHWNGSSSRSDGMSVAGGFNPRIGSQGKCRREATG